MTNTFYFCNINREKTIQLGPEAEAQGSRGSHGKSSAFNGFFSVCLRIPIGIEGFVHPGRFNGKPGTDSNIFK